MKIPALARCVVAGILGLSLPAVSAAERVVFNVDFTSGSAGVGTVVGGKWEKGWKTTGASGERIVFDAGRPIANGRLEVAFTADELPWGPEQGKGPNAEWRKINFLGLHEDSGLNQNTSTGDLFYARTGDPRFKFANIKVAGRRFDRSEFEPRVGDVKDWITDGRTEMTLTLDWRDGVPSVTLPDGSVVAAPRDIVGADTPIDVLRYVFLGSDKYTGLTVKGLCFKRMKLVEYGADVAGPEPTPLRVSESGRVLVDATGRPVFLLADTAWGLPVRITREEAEQYLRQRRSQRFNAVTFVLFTPGNPDISQKLENVYGDGPFEVRNGKPDPVRPIVTPGADPANAQQYDYWDHVDYLVQLTRRLGLYAILLPTWGSGVVGSMDGKNPEHVVFNEENARAYGRWVGARYRNEPHVIWMIGGDRAAVEGGRDFRPVFRAMAAGVAEVAPQLISYHPKKGGEQSGPSFHNERWLAFNSIQEWPEVQIVRIAEDWARTPPKPTWIFEGRYEGYWKRNYKPEDWGEWQMRQQAYQTVLGGAFGHTYGHERAFGFGQDGVNWKEHLDIPGARSMTHLAKVMNGFSGGDFMNRVPDQSLLDGDAGQAGREKSDRITAARTANGRQAIFYSASGRSIRVKMEQLAAGKMFAWWFNPRAGKWHVNGRETVEQTLFARELASGPGAGVREFAPPTSGEGNDWLLILSASEGV